MRKLGSIESFDAFVLGIAGGADVNGTWKGYPLVEFIFRELMHIHELKNDQHKTLLKKYQALVMAGADVTTIVYGSPGDYDNFFDLSRYIVLRLKLLSILLSSRQAKALILQDRWYSGALRELQTELRTLSNQLDEMESVE